MELQLAICKKYDAIPNIPDENSTVYIATSTIGKLPLNGLRKNPTDSFSGWYLWCGVDVLDTEDFYQQMPLHNAIHMLPLVERYLALPAGFRFLMAGAAERVWLENQEETPS